MITCKMSWGHIRQVEPRMAEIDVNVLINKMSQATLKVQSRLAYFILHMTFDMY